jgi:ribosomal protein S18 acetylase RimI-like enzyme
MLREEPQAFSTRWEEALREPEETWRSWTAEAAAGKARTLLVAEEEDGRWLGVAGGFVRVDPSEAQLVSMWVDTSARGRGVARALIQEIARWAGSRGCERLFLFVQEANGPAQRLYEQAGFRPTGARRAIPGRHGFKLVLSAPVPALLAATEAP